MKNVGFLMMRLDCKLIGIHKYLHYTYTQYDLTCLSFIFIFSSFFLLSFSFLFSFSSQLFISYFIFLLISYFIFSFRLFYLLFSYFFLMYLFRIYLMIYAININMAPCIYLFSFTKVFVRLKGHCKDS